MRIHKFTSLTIEDFLPWNDGSVRMAITDLVVDVERNMLDVRVIATENGAILPVDGHLVFVNPPTEHDGSDDPVVVLRAMVTEQVRRQIVVPE